MAAIKKIKCGWCGKSFTVPRTRSNNARKYCSTSCQRYAYLEKHAEANRKYNKRYGNPKQYLGNSGVKEHRNPDYIIELNIIRKEKRRLGL